MSMRFSSADLDRWVAGGVISAAQRDAMLADLGSRPAEGTGLNLTALLYYGGGLLVLLAYSIFLGLQWQDMNSGARIAISGASIAFFAGVATVLTRQERFSLPGELLQVVAVAIVPLFVFAVLDAADLWPDAPRYYRPDSARETYQLHLAWARIALAAATLVAAVGAFWWSRSPFVLIAAIVSVTSLCVDATIQVQGDLRYYDLRTPQLIAIAVVGGATLAAGILTRGRTSRGYALWLFIAGLTGLAVGLGGRMLSSEAAGWGILWLIVALAILALSLLLQERLFAAAGLAAVFAYFAKLVFDVFQSANAALALVVLGLLVLGAGMLYQRYNERLFSRPA